MASFLLSQLQNKQLVKIKGKVITMEPSREIMALFAPRKLILQTRMRSHPVGLDVWLLVGPFIYFHTSCIRTAKALVRLRGCAGSPESSLVAYVISTIFSWAGSIGPLSGNTCGAFTADAYISLLISPHLPNFEGITRWLVRPPKTQISLHIYAVWSKSSLCARRSTGSIASHGAPIEDSVKLTARMRRLIWVVVWAHMWFCRFCCGLAPVMFWLYLINKISWCSIKFFCILPSSKNILVY